MTATRSQAFTEEMKAAIETAIVKHLSKSDQIRSDELSKFSLTIAGLTNEICDLKRSLVLKDNIISKLETQVAQLETRPDTSNLLARIDQLEADHDSLEQYGRRLNIRVDNVPFLQGESPASLEGQVLGLLASAGAEIAASDVLRLHRSTPLRAKEGPDTTKFSQVIVRLNNWKARESAHNSRNAARVKGHAIKQDLTRARREMIAEANAAIRTWRELDEPVYCYANINCQVVMRRGRAVRRIHSTGDLKDAIAFFKPQ